MKKLLFFLSLSTGCLGDGVIGSDSEYSSVDNRSNARLVMVAESNWSFGHSDDWNNSCDGSPIDTLLVAVHEGSLIVTSTASLRGEDCTLSVRSAPVREIIIIGDGPLDVDGPCNDLMSIDVSGNGNVTLGTVETDAIDVSVTGNGTVDIADLQATELVLNLTGNGDVTLAGAVDDGDFTITGSGYLDASNLVIGDLVLNMSGSGDATVNVTRSISGDVGGSGNLVVLGGPGLQDVAVSASASGTITYE